MNIALLNTKITIEKQQFVTDKIGNHKNEWRAYHSCYATISGEGAKSGSEGLAAGTEVDHDDCCFTVRWCDALKSVTPTGYRITWEDQIYDIVSIDHLSNKKKALKMRCRKVRR